MVVVSEPVRAKSSLRSTRRVISARDRRGRGNVMLVLLLLELAQKRVRMVVSSMIEYVLFVLSKSKYKGNVELFVLPQLS